MVTKLLQNLSRYEHHEHVIFKGGTCLSKGYKLIQRFSEDIDLVLDKNKWNVIASREGDVLHKIIKKIVDKSFKKVKEGTGNISQKSLYKRVYEFEKNFTYPADSPIHGKIILEVNSFATPNPVESVAITSLVGDNIESIDGKSVLDKLDMKPFEVKALKPERAFCEKILALRRASNRETEFFGARVRHIYDIHQLLSSSRIQALISNVADFEEMLTMSYSDDGINQNITKEIGVEFTKSEIYVNPSVKIKTVQSQYNALKDITFDNNLPSIDEVSKTLKAIGIILKGYKFSS